MYVHIRAYVSVWQVADAIAEARSSKCLSLSNLSLRTVPEDVAGVPDLLELYLSVNDISKLPR